jgi:5-methylthioadenosine/S-adenosylhomocysteine deaminase
MSALRRAADWGPMLRGVWIGCVIATAVTTGMAAKPLNRLLVTNCQIITLVVGEEDPFNGYIVVGEDGRIAQIGHGRAPAEIEAEIVFDAAGKVAMPGFISGHSHLSGSVTRGLAIDQWVTEWSKAISWLSTAGRPEPGDYYHYVLHGALDMLRGGVTTVYNYTTGPVGAGSDLYLEQLEAEFAAGGHFVFGYYPPVRDPGKSFEQMKADVRAYLNRAQTHPRRELLLRSSFGSIAMRWTEDISQIEFDLLKAFPEFGLDMQMHYLEPPPTVPRTIYERGNFPWLKRHGVLGPNLTFAHFIHPTDEILTASVAAGATMIWNPLSNGRLGSGLADVPRYLKLGMTVGMGIDGQSSADVADPFENMRVGMYGFRFRDRDPRGFQPLDMLRLHTIGTAKAIRVDKDVGTLAVGKFGDVLLIDPYWPDTGPIIDLYATLVLACDRMNIASVFVAGRHVMEGGKHTTINMAEVSREVQRRVASKKGRPGS